MLLLGERWLGWPFACLLCCMRTEYVLRSKEAALQAGLNGVDNGQLWFNNVRVPRDALLDRYASVAEDGTYSSPIPSVAQRFGTMVGGLTTGASHSSMPLLEALVYRLLRSAVDVQYRIQTSKCLPKVEGSQ